MLQLEYTHVPEPYAFLQAYSIDTNNYVESWPLSQAHPMRNR